MSSRRILEIPVKVPIQPTEQRVELVCDWEKELYPAPYPGYRVQVVTSQKDKLLADSADVRDHTKLSHALRDCARRIQALEKTGWK